MLMKGKYLAAASVVVVILKVLMQQISSKDYWRKHNNITLKNQYLKKILSNICYKNGKSSICSSNEKEKRMG